jgi:hypothetical protein
MNGWSQNEWDCGKGRLMGALAFDAIAGAGNCHFGHQQRGFVGQSEAVVGRKLIDSGIPQVAGNRTAQVVDLLLAGFMRMNAVGIQQFFPGRGNHR